MKTIAAGALIIVLLCLSVANSQAAGYSYTNIIPPGWNQVGGLQAISDSGLVAGFGCKDPGMCELVQLPTIQNNIPVYGFTYKDGVYTETTPPGWHHGTVVAVNANGVVVGNGCKDAGGCVSNNGVGNNLPLPQRVCLQQRDVHRNTPSGRHFRQRSGH